MSDRDTDSREGAGRSGTGAGVLTDTWLPLAGFLVGVGVALSFGGKNTVAVHLIGGVSLLCGAALIGRGVTGSWSGAARMNWPLWLVGVLAGLFSVVVSL